jgi:hypothetical protein
VFSVEQKQEEDKREEEKGRKKKKKEKEKRMTGGPRPWPHLSGLSGSAV